MCRGQKPGYVREDARAISLMCRSEQKYEHKLLQIGLGIVTDIDGMNDPSTHPQGEWVGRDKSWGALMETSVGLMPGLT